MEYTFLELVGIITVTIITILSAIGIIGFLQYLYTELTEHNGIKRKLREEKRRRKSLENTLRTIENNKQDKKYLVYILEKIRETSTLPVSSSVQMSRIKTILHTQKYNYYYLDGKVIDGYFKNEKKR